MGPPQHEAEDVKAYRAALSDGWSADELRQVGFDEPEKKARTRRRAATARKTKARTKPREVDLTATEQTPAHVS